MQKHENGSLTLSREEVRSLRKVLDACSTALSDLSSGGDLIGWENDIALGMWEDMLKGDVGKLSWYIDNEDEEEEEDNEKKKPTTVDEWLFDYGEGYW